MIAIAIYHTFERKEPVMRTSKRRVTLWKPTYVYARCDCSRNADGISTHVVFYFDAFDAFARRILICMDCGAWWKEDNIDIKTRFDHLAASALSHPMNHTMIQ